MSRVLACFGIALSVAFAAAVCSDAAGRQIAVEAPTSAAQREESAHEQPVKAPKQVDVEPVARDSQIKERLQRILTATAWFDNPRVQVEEGVVFLEGTAKTSNYREWAEELTRNTQDVVAVVNKMDVELRPIWDLQPALTGVRDLGRDVILWLPFMLLAFVILALASVVSWVMTYWSRRVLRRRIKAPLLREVAARVVGSAVLIIGLYIVLRVCGLSRLALTVVGGTGLIGLVIGIAFRDITENFLASLFLSAQRPFRVGDLVEIADVLGYVQRLTVRTTILMTLNGNHVQIPNSTVYKSTIRNYSSNPNRREDFSIGIGYQVPIPRAQEVALAAIQSHPAVLKDPEPWVLADSLGPATVNLRVYFWLNGKEHSWLKVRSSVIRLVKRTFQDNGIEMPDEAREIVFPKGVPVELIDGRSAKPTVPNKTSARDAVRNSSTEAVEEPVSTGAEAGLTTEAEEIEHQARQASSPDAGENLLVGH